MALAPLAESNATGGSGDLVVVSRSCSRAIRGGKSHLRVCLKLLGILYQGEEENGALGPEGTNGDDLYLAMVMLNSSLLKAMHVVDSFQAHTQREYPQALPSDEAVDATNELEESWELFLFEDDDFGDDLDDLGADGSIIERADVAVGSTGPSGSNGTVNGEDYRRLQAQCVVLTEALRSSAQQRGADADRLAKLEEDCRQLRLALNDGRPLSEATEAAKESEPEPNGTPEVIRLSSEGQDVTVRHRPGGVVAVSEGGVQRLVAEVQALRGAAERAQEQAREARESAEESARRITEMCRTEEELRSLLCGLEASSEGCAEDLEATVRRLLSEVDNLETEVACPNGGSQPRPDDGSEAPAWATTTPSGSNQAAPVAQEPLEPDGLRSLGGLLTPPAQPLHSQLGGVSTAAPSTVRTIRPGGAGRSNGMSPLKPAPGKKTLVTSPPTSTAQEVAQRRAAYGALVEERQHTRAALQSAAQARSRDSQALGRLAGLLGGVRSSAAGPCGVAPHAVVGGAVPPHAVAAHAGAFTITAAGSAGATLQPSSAERLPEVSLSAAVPSTRKAVL